MMNAKSSPRVDEIDVRLRIKNVLEDQGTFGWGVAIGPGGSECTVYIPVKVMDAVRPRVYEGDVLEARMVMNHPDHRHKADFMVVWIGKTLQEAEEDDDASADA